jgi:hypothetical protein
MAITTLSKVLIVVCVFGSFFAIAAYSWGKYVATPEHGYTQQEREAMRALLDNAECDDWLCELAKKKGL